MAKKTKEELAEQRKRRKAAIEERERQKQTQYEKDLFDFIERRRLYIDRRRKYDLMLSDMEGWYEEIDKQTKKSPADQVTDLQLETVNDIINQIKELMSDDEIITKVKQFVAAGDNAEYRDVIVVLRRLKQGLDRFAPILTNQKKLIEDEGELLFGDRTEDSDNILNVDLKTLFDRKEFHDKQLYDRL